MLRQYIIVFFFLCTGLRLAAQDASYTQFYAMPLYMNPAFTGTTPHHRLNLAYRAHWANLPRAFVSTTLTYDLNLKDSPANIGFLVHDDRQGSASLSATGLSAIYAHQIPFRNSNIMTALQIGYTTESMDYHKLVFEDQIRFGNTGAPSNDPAVRQLEMDNYLDLGAGILYYGPKVWVGMALHHINQPNVSIIGGESEWPMRISLHGGYKFFLAGTPFTQVRSSLMPVIQLRRQGRFDQLDLGMIYQNRMLSMGVYYKGMVFQSDMPGVINHDALSLSFGMQTGSLNFSYSYDLTISKLGPASGGSHEISLGWEFVTKPRPGKVSREQKYNPCPAFTPNYLWKP